MKFKKITLNPAGILVLLVLFLVHWALGVGYIIVCGISIWLVQWYYKKIYPTNHLLYTAWYTPAGRTTGFYPALRIGERNPKIAITLDHIIFKNYEDAIQEAIPTATLLNELNDIKKI